MNIYEICDKEFKTIMLKILSVPLENTDTQLNKIWKIRHEQNENINKEKL